MNERLENAAAAMRRAGAQALLLTPGADLFYLTGFEHGHAGERLLGLVLREDGRASWIGPLMNVPQIEQAAAGAPVRGWSDADGYVPALREALAGADVIAFDEEARSAFLLDLMRAVPQARVIGSGDIMRSLRIRKNPDELAALRRAAATVDQTIPEAISFCRPGRREDQIDQDLRAALLRREPDAAIAFTIIASGPNAALPHHETERRVVQQGGVVILDFGTRTSVSVGGKRSRMYGYHSDITVTCSVGEPADPEARKVYRIVWEAQQAALQAVRPGVTCQSIDRAARQVIERAG